MLRSVRSCESISSDVEEREDLLLSVGIVAARRLTRPVASDRIELLLLLLMVFVVVSLMSWATGYST